MCLPFCLRNMINRDSWPCRFFPSRLSSHLQAASLSLGQVCDNGCITSPSQPSPANHRAFETTTWPDDNTMAPVICCFAPLRREKRDQAEPSGKRATKLRNPAALAPPSLLQPLGPRTRRPSFAPLAFSPSPFSPSSLLAPSSVMSSPMPSPERALECAPRFRRPSSTFAPSTRLITRDPSRMSSFETAPPNHSSLGFSSYRDVALVARDIWEEAYHEVCNDEALKPLVKNYEELYNTISTRGLFGSRRSSHAPKDPLSGDDEYSAIGEESFSRLGQEYLEMARRDSASHSIVSSAIQFIQRTRDVVGIALAASPPASVAWTGICTIVLPVSAFVSVSQSPS